MLLSYWSPSGHMWFGDAPVLVRASAVVRSRFVEDLRSRRHLISPHLARQCPDDIQTGPRLVRFHAAVVLWSPLRSISTALALSRQSSAAL